MLRPHRVLALLMLQGCSLLADFDHYSFGNTDAGAAEDAGNWASDAGLLPGEVPGDAGEIVDAGPGDAGLLPRETPGDAGEIVDAGHVSADAGPGDAGALPQLGPYTTADLPRASFQKSEKCGNVSLFQSKWPRSTVSEDPACPEWLVQSAPLVLMRDFGSSSAGSVGGQCDWLGAPEGVTFTLDGYPTERTMFAQWGAPNRMTVIWRGLICVYKAGSEL